EIVQKEGNRNVKREQEFYNLDAIIAVGYRVNSKKATRFRQWATKTLREYITKGFVLNDDMLKNGKPMQDWVDQTNQFLMNNRRKVLEGKGRVSHDEAIEKANKEYKVFRVKQDQEYVSEFDREVEKYLKGEK
ncbi:MAG: virulence RhuM family protein, partial [Eubacterium sp.]|nr:virulence RhuM family protein [Eubacterium sp.]